MTAARRTAIRLTAAGTILYIQKSIVKLHLRAPTAPLKLCWPPLLSPWSWAQTIPGRSGWPCLSLVADAIIKKQPIPSFADVKNTCWRLQRATFYVGRPNPHHMTAATIAIFVKVFVADKHARGASGESGVGEEGRPAARHEIAARGPGRRAS